MSPQLGRPSDPHVPWVVRVVAVVFVLPFRLAWELLKVLGRAAVTYVFRPLGWLLHRLIVVPLDFLWHNLVARPFGYLWRHLLRPALEFLGRYLLVVPLRFAWHHLLRPLWHYLVEIPLAFLWRRCLVPLAELLWRPVLRLLTILYRYLLRPGWLGAGWLLYQVYRFTLRPVGLVVGWVWRHTAVPVGRALRSGGRWLRQAVLTPAAGLVRAMFRG